MSVFLELLDIDTCYDNQCDYNIQGFIYNFIKADKNYSHSHNKKGYKFFCFSNVFPIQKRFVMVIYGI